MIFKFSLALIFLFLLSLALLRSTNPGHVDLNTNGERKDFPELELTDETSAKVSLKTLYGKVTLLNFWATWCAPCREELPQFKSLTETFGNDFQIIAINEDDGPDSKAAAGRMWSQYSMPLKTYFDPNHAIANQLSVEALPTSFILDRKGRLVFSAYGVVDWTGESVKNMLKELVAED